MSAPVWDWCGHVAEGADQPCGAPVERWSYGWRHRTGGLDGDHAATPQAPLETVDEGMMLRATRYAEALAAAAAAEQRVLALTDLVAAHEYARTQAEQALAGVQENPAYGQVWSPTGPEPEDAAALLCLTTGHVFLRDRSETWRRADLEPDSAATRYEWPIQDAGPFIAWSDSYGYDRVLRDARRAHIEMARLRRSLYGAPGYDSSLGWRDLTAAVEGVRRAAADRIVEANRKEQAASQQLRNLRRLLGGVLEVWDGGGRGSDAVNALLCDVQEILAKPSCGGAA